MIELPFCPRCKEDLEGMMTRSFRGVLWCHLCSFDVEESPKSEQDHQVAWAKEYKKEMLGK